MKPKLWKIVATEENSQDGDFIASTTMDVVDEVEAAAGKVGFVTGVITDNVKAIQAAWNILEKEKGIICAGCGAHTLNLLLQDIGKMQSVKNVMEKATRVVTYILARKVLFAKFEKERKAAVKRRSSKGFNQTLTLPVVTRWYSAFDCLVSVIKNRDSITGVFEDSKFMAEYEPKPKRKSKKAAGKRRRGNGEAESEYDIVERILREDNFWVRGKQVIKVLSPIIKKLGLLETDGCSAGMVYWSFVDLLKTPIYLDPPFLADTATGILECIKTRWEFLHTDAMGVAFLLDPTKSPADFVDDDLDKSLEHVREIAARLNFPKDQQDAAFREACVFVNSKWDRIQDDRELEGSAIAPLEWWGVARRFFGVESRRRTNLQKGHATHTHVQGCK